MAQNNDPDIKPAFDSLVAGSTDAGAIKTYYDEWAKTYDTTLKAWGYRAPAEAAETLSAYLRSGVNILDVGCGTGMFAKAISTDLECQIEGLDISLASLEIAERKGRYNRVRHHDLNSIPLPVDNDTFDAAVCIGVLTYIEDANDLLVDLCRVVRSGGYVLFTQRDDRWAHKEFSTVIDNLQARQLWKILNVSRARPYLPDNTEFSDLIRVIQVLCRVL